MDATDVCTAIRGFGVGGQTRMDPQAVVALGNRLGATEDGLRRAAADAATARFGPDAMSPDLREHGLGYAAGMRTLGAVVEALVESVTDLTDRLGTAAEALEATDGQIGASVTARGDSL